MTRARALLLAACGLALIAASGSEARPAEPAPSSMALGIKLGVAFIVAAGVVIALCMIAACMRLTADEKERARREAERGPKWREREKGEG